MDYSFGNWIKHRRKVLDLTQRELAQRIGCSLSLIFKLESDERRPSRQIAELLARHLEIPPDQQAVFMKVARQEKSVDALEPVSLVPDPKSAHVSAPSQISLPLALTSFVGREHELGMIIRQIQDPACRLLTLTGPGGVGKTRLALEVAQRVYDTFEFGAYFVPLAGTSAPEFIAPAIADGLGFTFSGTSEPKVQLFNYLREKHVLLILDSLEHLLNDILLLDELLELAPGVKLLATSREQLNLHAEWSFEVQGLPVPAHIDLDNLESNSSVALFAQRAKQAKMDFTLTAQDLPSVKRICQLVEGLPLGLELAATWVRKISLGEVAAEIERNMDFLTTRARDIPQRHRSIRAVFDHSWRLLAVEERRVMRQLSLFRGGFTRQAAEQVAGASLALLSALIDKSLVRRREADRYELHELIRQYAAALLKAEAQEELDTLGRFNSYYLTLLAARDRALRSNLQKDVWLELTGDIDNIRAAWESALTYADGALIQKAAFPFWYFHNLRDSLHEGESAFARAAEALRARLAQTQPGDRAPACKLLEAVLGELLSHQAQFTFRQGRIAEAAKLYQSSLELLRPLDEPLALAHALTYAGVVSWIAGEFDQALPFLNESKSIADNFGDLWLQSQCRTFLGMLAFAQGDYHGAYQQLNESMTRARALGDARLISVTVGQLGRAAQALGRSREVLDLMAESLRLANETGDRLGSGVVLEQMAVALRAGGDEAEARRLLSESIRQFRDIGDTWFLAHALNLEGYHALDGGEYTLAEESFRQACSIAIANQAPPNALDALAGMARIDAQQGCFERALKTALQILQHPASTQEAKDRAGKLQLELQAKFSPQQLEAIQVQAHTITLEDLAREIWAAPG